MNHTEIFELCENSAKHRCPDCNVFSEIGIFYCICGRNLKFNSDFTSIPGFVIKKNSSRRPKHGVSERQVMFYKTKQMLNMANMAAIRRHFQGGTNKKDTESHWRSTTLAKRRSCFSIASLLKDTTVQLRELSGCRTSNIGFFV